MRPFPFFKRNQRSAQSSTKSIVTRSSSEEDDLSVQYTVKAQASLPGIPVSAMEPKTNWTSIGIASFLSVCGAVQQSLYFSSLWPYLQVVDTSVTEHFLGYAIGIHSFGQIIGAPLVGYWSNRCRRISPALLLGLTMMLVGNGIYLCVQLLPSNRKYLVLLSRFIVGIGSSNISLLRAYASTASTPTERSRAIAYVIGGNALGMSIGPALQLLASPIGYPGLVVAGTFSLSMYTVPAVMACCMNVIGMLAVYFVFKESYAGVVDKGSSSTSTEAEELPKCDQWAVLLCNFSRFVHKLVSANTETLSAPLAMAVFAFTKTDVLQYVSMAQTLRSLAGFGVYVVYAILNVEKRFARFDFRWNCLASLVGLVAFYLLTFPWPFLPGHLQTFSSSTYNGTAEDISGCDVDSFTWCETLRPVNVYLYYASYVLFIGIFYPNFNISFSTLFSRILGPTRQGTQQGILQVSEGSATMAGPVFISALYTAYGPQAAWILQIATLSSVFALWIASYGRLVPREKRRVMKKQMQKF